MKFTLLTLFLLFLHISFAQQSIESVQSGCMPGYNHTTLNINNMEAYLLTDGDMHWNLNGWGYYRFPKGSSHTVSGPAGLWIGGYSGTDLRTACQTYRQNGTDFWPGPLDPTTADVADATCYYYDRFNKMDYLHINEFISHFNNGTAQNGSYIINPVIQNWTGLNYQYSPIAPVVDIDSNGQYNPKEEGDYPLIKGDQAAYYIFNDRGNIHTNSNSVNSLGLEIDACAYAYGCPQTIDGRPELLNSTFYNYKIINRSAKTYTNTFIGIWVNAWIGYNHDDFVGTNPKLGYAYAYNGYNTDSLYGAYTPATGTVMLKAPRVGFNDGIDNDLDSIIDEPDETYLIPNMYSFNTSMEYGTQNDSTSPSLTQSWHYYNLLSGKWPNGNVFSCGGNAYDTLNTTPVKHVYPGTNSIDPNCNGNWTEITAGNTPGTRCYLLSMGPLTFNSGDSIEIEFAFVTSIDSTQPNNNWASVVKLESDIAKVKAFYSLPTKPSCIDKIDPHIITYDNTISIYPTPANETLTIKSTFSETRVCWITDLLGRTVRDPFYINYGDNGINISTLSSGMYFIYVENSKSPIKYKLIKK